MKGYKALDTDMRAYFGDGTKFDLGKQYCISSRLEVGRCGFHFCRCLHHIERYYRISKSRIFEVEADGEIQKDEQKYASEKIRLIRELTQDEIREYFVKHKNRLVKSKNCHFRSALAEQGLCLEKLVYDEDSMVREKVARQGYGLDILIKDENKIVRTIAQKIKTAMDNGEPIPYIKELVPVRDENDKSGFMTYHFAWV